MEIDRNDLKRDYSYLRISVDRYKDSWEIDVINDLKRPSE